MLAIGSWSELNREEHVRLVARAKRRRYQVVGLRLARILRIHQLVSQSLGSSPYG